jgi:Uncharacterized protein conserved in bacteria
MKSVLIIKGQSNYDVLKLFSDELGKGFEQIGVKVYFFDLFSDTESLTKTFAEAISNGCKHAIAFNAYGYDLQIEGESFYNYYNLTFIAILVDHPLYHANRIKYKIDKKIITCVDREHLKFVKDFLKDSTPVYFLPHGGFSRSNTIIENANKRTDVLFAGSYSSPDNIFDNWKQYAKHIRMYLETMSNELLNNEEETIYNVTCKYFGNDFLNSEKVTLLSIFRIMWEVDKYVRAVRRTTCVTELVEAGIPLTVYGDNWEKLKVNKTSNFIIKESVSFNYINYLASKSKIVLNVLPCFIDGSHERVFTAMLNGAVCVTDYSKYLAENFQDGKDIIFYKWKELDKLPQKITNVLNNSNQEIDIKSAYCKAEQFHTWKNRAEALMDIIQSENDTQ